MALNEKLRPVAERKLNEILHCRLTNYSRQSSFNFMKEMTEKVRQLLHQPASGRLSRGNTVEVPLRYIGIADTQRLYYTYDEFTLSIVDFIHVRAGANPYEQ